MSVVKLETARQTTIEVVASKEQGGVGGAESEQEVAEGDHGEVPKYKGTQQEYTAKQAFGA